MNNFNVENFLNNFLTFEHQMKVKFQNVEVLKCILCWACMLSEVKIVNVMWCLARVHMLFNVSDVVNVNCEMVTGETDVNQFMNEGVCATVLVNWMQSWVWIGEWWWVMEWCDRVMILQIESSSVCYTINKRKKLQPTQSTIKARALPMEYREYKHTK